MSARFLPFVAGSLFTAAVVLVGVGVSQAQQSAPLPPVAPQAVVVAPPPPVQPAAAAPRAPSPMFQPEQALDTSDGPTMMPAAPLRTVARAKVRTPDDDTLPKWVPKRGRLTVVESSDLAENLGLVPRGTTKKSAERISAQDKLEEEAQARAARGTEPSTGFAFSVKSHIKNHR